MKMGIFTVMSIFVYCLSLFAVTVANQENNCTHTHTSLLVCSSNVPETVPAKVTHVILNGVNFENFYKGQFNDSSWINVRNLEIDAPFGLYLSIDVFYGLHNLYYLKVKGTELNYLDRYSFRWLPNVEKLDLSDNVRLSLRNVLVVLRDEVNSTLPSLKWLNLAKIQTFYVTPIECSAKSNAFGILARRKIEYLDLSGCTISPFDIDEMGKMCSSLKQFILRETIITDPQGITAYLCNSLQKVDLSYSQALDLSAMNKFLTLFPGGDVVLVYFLRLLLNVETLLMSHMLSNDPLDFQKTIHISLAPARLKKIDLSFNNLHILNGSIVLHPVTAESIRQIDFSNNVIEFMSPDFLGASFHNEILNLSHNSLEKMATHFTREFELLIGNLTHLRILDLTKNGLKYLPRKFFDKNIQLSEIYLSRNSLHVFDFKVNHLTKLQILDLHGNRIKFLDSIAIRQLENIGILRSAYNTTVNKTRQNSLPNVYFHDNPMVCGCDEETVKSLKWIVRGGYVFHTDTLACSFNGDSLTISDTTLETVLNECYVINLRKTLLLSGLVLVLVVSTCILLVVIIWRYKKRRNSMKTFINIIKSNDKIKYLIFLSFCNEDGDLVLEHIYPRLRDEVSRTLDCDRNLVCCGELNFRPGMSVCLEVSRCMEESAVVIFVVSKTFCRKDWCKMEVDTANAKRKPVILLFLEKVDPEFMTPYIQELFARYSRATWNGNQDGGELHPPWSVLISSVIELGCTFHEKNKPMKEVEMMEDTRL